MKLQLPINWLYQLPTVSLGKWAKLDPIYVVATCVAIGIHIFILMISFAMPDPQNAMTQDVTLAVQLTTNEKNDKADFLAQANQKGSGETKHAQKVTNSDISPYNQESLDEVNPNENLDKQEKAVEANSEQHVLYTTLNFKKEQDTKEKARKKLQNEAKDKVNSTSAMIATLEAEYSKQKQELTKQNSIETVSSVSTKSDMTATYVDNFKKTVERVGNRYYPIEAKLNRLGGDVRMLVVLKPDGSVKALQILKSSGLHILDEAAKESVRYGAPYKKFPVVMNQISELRIIRTWRFVAGQEQPEISND